MANHKQRLDKIERSCDPQVALRFLFVRPGETGDKVLETAGQYKGRTILVSWEEGDGKP